MNQSSSQFGAIIFSKNRSGRGFWCRIKLLTAGTLTLLTLFAGCRPEAKPQRVAVIVGGSMAPTLRGDSDLVRCQECDYKIYFSSQGNTPPQTVICPNCGASQTHASPEREKADAVTVVAQPTSKLKRWDIVAFQQDDSPNAIIKRIVGLPNESITFSCGDIFANEKRLIKPFSVNRSLRIPVFDSQFQSPAKLPRLRPDDSDAAWSHVGKAIVFHPSTSQQTPAWLTYHPRRCCEHDGPDRDFPIEDYYGDNQSLPRNLHPLDDIFVAFDCELVAESEITIRFTRGSTQHDFEIAASQPTVRYVSRSINPPKLNQERWFQIEQIDYGKSVPIELCTFDRQLTLNVNQKSIVIEEPNNETFDPVSKNPIRLAASSGKVTLTRFRLWRDIYYYDPTTEFNGPPAHALTAGPNEYLMLGDNVPVSIDSRHWPSAGISAEDILGTVQSTRELAQ